VELFKASDEFGLEHLRSECELLLIELLDEHSVVGCLVLSSLHDIPDLKQAAFEFLRLQPGVLLLEEFDEMRRNHPALEREIKDALRSKRRKIDDGTEAAEAAAAAAAAAYEIIDAVSSDDDEDDDEDDYG
jgi:hypothetical protein